MIRELLKSLGMGIAVVLAILAIPAGAVLILGAGLIVAEGLAWAFGMTAEQHNATLIVCVAAQMLVMLTIAGYITRKD